MPSRTAVIRRVWAGPQTRPHGLNFLASRSQRAAQAKTSVRFPPPACGVQRPRLSPIPQPVNRAHARCASSKLLLSEGMQFSRGDASEAPKSSLWWALPAVFGLSSLVP
eukprot:1938494-Amphidinium_carterae.1